MQHLWTAFFSNPRTPQRLATDGSGEAQARELLATLKAGVRSSEHHSFALEKLTRKILVPTDFSLASRCAVGRAVALANQCNAAVTILHIVNVNTQSGCGPADEVMQRRWTEGSVQLAQLAGSLSGQLNAQMTIEEGLPWRKIVAKSGAYDLLILGKGPRKSGWQLFSQKTLERVLEEAACPVMVVRWNDEGIRDVCRGES